ncbi:MAG TPA: EF-P beta-lysylation protein EpmB [Steroidobacteraceae bacterium]
MITASTPPRQLEPPRWQHEMAAAITSLEDLAQALGLTPAALGAAGVPAQGHGATPAPDGAESRADNAAAFRLLVPASYVGRMRRGDPRDPLLLQVLPSRRENDDFAGYDSDPVGERDAMRAPGLLKKYEGRALLITTSACAIHCRYCFRREFPYPEHQSESKRWSAALEEISRDASIEEVILSGGDPLSLSDARLASLTDAISKIRHVRRIRVHTRQPIVLPSRVDSGLIAWLKGIGVPTVIVLHSNHPNEISDEVREACRHLRQTGVTLLNQSVLLRDVNDNADILAELSQKLFDAGVLPYYLHVLDRVRGAAHFDISEDSARTLAGQLAARLPGYLVPRLVREVHGAPAKVGIAPRF